MRRLDPIRRRIAAEGAQLRLCADGPDVRTLSELGGSVDEIKRLLTPALVQRLRDGDLNLMLAHEGHGGNYIPPRYAREMLGVAIWNDDQPWALAEPRRSSLQPDQATNLASAKPALSETPQQSRRGRKPKTWWPLFSALFAHHIHKNGVPERQAELEGALLQALNDHGHDVSRSTIQPAITQFFDLLQADA